MVLPQQHRLRGLRVFDRLYRDGRRFQGRAMVLRVLQARAELLPPQEQELERRHRASPWRCGVVVSSKVSKRSVQRNRLRRQLHHHVLQLLQPAPQHDASPVWLLISLKPGSQENGREDLLEECSDLLRKAGLCP